MKARRVLAIGLDGFDMTLARQMMASGQLPVLAGLLQQGLSFDLDHGDARETGLAWEHFATGHSPDDYRRWSAVTFDPAGYKVVQSATRARAFTEAIGARVVAFDMPYHRLQGPQVQGIANWGAHDPGVAAHANPPDLGPEMAARFGPYPAQDWIYGFTWPWADRTQVMADALVRAAELRTEIALWLLGERLPDWDLGIVVTAELHSGLEALYHGIDPAHPLHHHPSAVPARAGVMALFAQTDRMLGLLAARFPDAVLVVFAMHGMGPNLADLPSMLFLPELMYRRATGRAFLHPRPDWQRAPGVTLGPYGSWPQAVLSNMGPRAQHGPWRKLLRRFRLWPRPVAGQRPADRATGADLALGWMPAARYAPFWPQMPAFALPAFYDGRIRVNLQGREAAGLVPLAAYGATLDAIEADLRLLTDGDTGQPVVTSITRPVEDDPLAATPTQADLAVMWSSRAAFLRHPLHGDIGPVPYRRTGGHTGGHGMALLSGPGIAPGHGGLRSSFDVVPTLLHLLGEPPGPVTGRSLI